MIQELKDHQVFMSNNMKEEFNENLMHTFRALNLISDNADDINYQLDKENVPQNKTQDDSMFAMKSHSDPAIAQLIQQVSFMQNAMQAFMSDDKQGRANDTNKGKNLVWTQSIQRLVKHGRGIVGLAVAVLIGEKIARIRKVDIRTRPHSKIA